MRTVDPETWHNKLYKQPSQPRSLRGLDRDTGLEMRIRQSWCDTMLEYWRNNSVRGVTRMSDTRLSKLERYQHGVVWVVSLCCGVCAVLSRVAQLRDTPAHLVTRHWAQRSIQHIPFPAVALCSNNVIAQRPLDNFTDYLSRGGNHSYNASTIRENLLQFGPLLTMELPNVNVNFMQFLAAVDPRFNVTRLMDMFSSPCDTMLKRCSWRGEILPCHRFFASRVTPLGFCCVFNSRYNEEDARRRPQYLDMVGQEYGLTVIVHENPDDFAYIRRASVGVDVLLFDGNEYPILEGGGVRMYPMEQNTSVFMSVSASAQQLGAGAAPVGGCRARARRAGYAWCLTECRRRTLASLCGCRLHTLPPDPTDNTFTCSLIDLPCLNKHREKFIYYYPEGYSTPALEEELQNGQVCRECAPDCARYLYSAATSVARYSPDIERKLFRRRITEGTSLVNATVIRLFYSSEHQQLYSIEESKRWYESVAMIGSLWSGVTGGTVVSASELVFYHCIRWVYHYRRRTTHTYTPGR